jgi:hypothetical protein
MGRRQPGRIARRPAVGRSVYRKILYSEGVKESNPGSRFRIPPPSLRRRIRLSASLLPLRLCVKRLPSRMSREVLQSDSFTSSLSSIRKPMILCMQSRIQAPQTPLTIPHLFSLPLLTGCITFAKTKMHLFETGVDFSSQSLGGHGEKSCPIFSKFYVGMDDGRPPVLKWRSSAEFNDPPPRAVGDGFHPGSHGYGGNAGLRASPEMENRKPAPLGRNPA